MYTKGIRKIFTTPKHYGHIDELFKMAEAAGFSACAHNGFIFVNSKGLKWAPTDYELSGFSDEKN